MCRYLSQQKKHILPSWIHLLSPSENLTISASLSRSCINSTPAKKLISDSASDSTEKFKAPRHFRVCWQSMSLENPVPACPANIAPEKAQNLPQIPHAHPAG